MSDDLGTGGEEKKPYVRQRPGMSVYISEEISRVLGGRRSTTFGQAIRCWARYMLDAAVDIEGEGSLTPAEWGTLARVLSGREYAIDPESGRPGPMIGEEVSRAAEMGQAKSLGSTVEELRTLAGRLAGLDYVHAWAVLWAIQWRAYRGIETDGAERWWTLAHRQESSQSAVREDSLG